MRVRVKVRVRLRVRVRGRVQRAKPRTIRSRYVIETGAGAW